MDISEGYLIAFFDAVFKHGCQIYAEIKLLKTGILKSNLAIDCKDVQHDCDLLHESRCCVCRSRRGPTCRWVTRTSRWTGARRSRRPTRASTWHGPSTAPRPPSTSAGRSSCWTTVSRTGTTAAAPSPTPTPCSSRKAGPRQA